MRQTSNPEPFEGRMLHFLLAEDDDDHAELMAETLQRHRVVNTLDRVRDGVEALAYLRQQGPHANKPHPGVVLLDLNMPRLNGHEVLKQMKLDPVLRTIPVVVLTTSDAEIDRLKAYEHYANSYLVKPVDFARFAKMVEELCLYWGVWNTPPP